MEESKLIDYTDKMKKHLALLKKNINNSKYIGENIEHLNEIVKIFIWGEKNRQIFLDFFVKNDILNYFVILANKNIYHFQDKENSVKLIKYYSVLLVNLKTKESIDFVYSQSDFNNFLKIEFDFEDEEIVFYFVNFAKGLSQRFNNFPFAFFYNEVSLKETQRLSYLL